MQSSIRSSAKRFIGDRSGHVALMAGLFLSVVSGAGLFAADYARAARWQVDLQKAADAAALASARQLPFILVDKTGRKTESGKQSRTLTAIATGMVDSALLGSSYAAETSASLVGESRVHVEVKAHYESLFGGLTGFADSVLSVQADAETYGGQNICLIATYGGSKRSGVELSGGSHLDGRNCGIYSAAPDKDSIKVGGTSRIDATLICAAGGYDGADGAFSTSVTTDCPQIEDPLALRPFPEYVMGCDFGSAIPPTPTVFESGTHTLEPGSYCGGLIIRGDADVFLNPGEYLFKYGDLHVAENAKLSGDGVGIYFQDLFSSFKFVDNADIALSAPTEGAMAGVVLATRRWCSSESCEFKRTFEISSPNVRSLLGTVYMPMDQLIVDTTMPVSSEAAFTIVMVGNLLMKQSPTLVLNSDYQATDVPVPAGFAGVPNTRIVN